MAPPGGDGPTWKDWRYKAVRAHRRKVFTLGWNSEGKRLASGSVDMTVRINRVDEACGVKAEGELRGHAEGVTNLAWHPTHPDKLASIAGQEKSVRFWDTRQSKNTATVTTPGANLYLAWSPDAHYVAVANRDDVVAVIDARKMKVAHKYAYKVQVNPSYLNPSYATPLMVPRSKMKVAHKYAYKVQVNDLAFARDGRSLFLCSGEGEVEVHSFPDMRRSRVLRGHTSGVFTLAFDRQQRWMASGGADAVACLWDTQDWICQRAFTAMDYPIRSLSFSADGRYLSIAGEQAVLDVEDLTTGTSLGRLPLKCTPEDAQWNPRHNVLACTGAYGTDSLGQTYGDIELRWKPR